MNEVFPEILTENLLLRQIVSSDLENIFAGLSHPDVIRYYGVSFATIKETKEQLNWYADLEKTGTGIWWAICTKSEGEFLGAAGFNNLSCENRKAEIGFWLMPRNWGKGVLTEVLPQILKYAFEVAKLHRVEAFVEEANTNCISLLNKMNFTKEGTMHDCEIKNDEFINLVIFAKLANSQ